MNEILKQLLWTLLICVAFFQVGQSQTYIKPFIGLNAFNLSGQNCNSLQAGTSSVTNCYDGFTIIKDRFSPSIKYGLEVQKYLASNWYIGIQAANQQVKTDILGIGSGGFTYLKLNGFGLNVALDRRITSFKIGLGLDLLHLSNFVLGHDRRESKLVLDYILDIGLALRLGYVINNHWSIDLNLRRGLLKTFVFTGDGELDTLNPSNYAELTFGYHIEL